MHDTMCKIEFCQYLSTNACNPSENVVEHLEDMVCNDL